MKDKIPSATNGRELGNKELICDQKQIQQCFLSQVAGSTIAAILLLVYQ
ncbi:MAG: hypothetical protein WCL21_08965 [Mariniphaga sp.]